MPMRTTWKGAVSFGLVSISVNLYAATENRSVAFHQVHAEDGGRVQTKRVCSAGVHHARMRFPAQRCPNEVGGRRYGADQQVVQL